MDLWEEQIFLNHEGKVNRGSSLQIAVELISWQKQPIIYLLSGWSFWTSEAHLLFQSEFHGMQLQSLLSLCNIAIDFLTSLNTIIRKSLFLTLKPLEILLGTPF